MSNTITLQDWLRNIDGEYLSSFIRQGGASIKFAVTPEELKPRLYEAVNGHCRERDYVFAILDAAAMRAHMPQDLFFGLARQIDWRLLARRVILRLAAGKGYAVEHVDAEASNNVFSAIADANAIELQFLLGEIRPELQNHVFKNRQMAKDFRVAMTRSELRVAGAQPETRNYEKDCLALRRDGKRCRKEAQDQCLALVPRPRPPTR